MSRNKKIEKFIGVITGSACLCKKGLSSGRSYKTGSGYLLSSIMLYILPLLFSFIFAACENALLGPEPVNTPVSNFEILWKTMDENYALFPVKSVNWDSLHYVYGSKITGSTSDSDLWNLFSELIQSLNDGHVALIDKSVSKVAQSSEICKRKMDDFNLELIKNKFLDNYKVAGGGYFVYGKIKSSFSNKNIGYIYILTFQGAKSGNSYEWSYDIDKIVKELFDCDAMIIDLRNNGGGLKVTLGIIASAFLDHGFTYFYQQEKTGPGHNDFGEPAQLSISPRAGVFSYTKKIALLTNRFSASGSEHFARIFKYLPYAVQIGDTTLGCFGDIIGNSELPNGWVFWYPIRLTKTPEGYCPEGVGIIPELLVENTKQDIDAGRDNVMARAINYLSQ